MLTESRLSLREKIENRTAVIGIIGLGYVGLPLAVAFANAQFKVVGFDVLKVKAESVNRGESYIEDVDRNKIHQLVETGHLEATTVQSRASEMDAICICVPTPLTKTKDPDLSFVVGEAEALSKYLRRGQLVVLESTTYPGTTREVVLPILENSGLKEGTDFFLAFSPERIDPGSRKYSISNTPKVVGGASQASTDLAALLYSQVADVVVQVSSPEVAEMTKVFENVFRSVNIALVNELTLLCEKMGISVWEVIDTAATKPFGFMPFYPGPGIGGHCIPLDPYYLADKAREYDFHTRFIELAAETNERMPYYVTSRIMEELNKRARSLSQSNILILGIAYKRNVADLRESPSLKLMELIQGKGATVRYNDPYVKQASVSGVLATSSQLTDELLKWADCVVIATDHSSYNYADVAQKARFVFDTRGATRGIPGHDVVRM